MSKKKRTSKIYVLDTSVIIHDHNSFLNFEDNDIAIPITVLEELDNFKKGNDTKNFEAREFTRIVDKLSAEHTLQDWIPLGKSKNSFFKIIFSNQHLKQNAELIFDDKKGDHKILNAALSLKESEKDRKVILVSKDINLRIKAKALNLQAEDYNTGKVKDVSDIYLGKDKIDNLESEVIKEIYEKGYLDNYDFLSGKPQNNHFYILKNGKASSLAFYNPIEDRLDRIEKINAYGIVPRNAEQAFALHAILNPDVKLVTIQGVAGTGKTLLALAGAIEQRRNFKQIILARPIVPLSNKDIGFLPGDIKDKINPYMEPLWDNLKFIKNQFSEMDKNHKQILDMQKNEKIIITPLAYIRGRSLSDIIFIVDEAQNLTPHEVKTIITRAGENTKMIFTGDINQIDTPYLDEHSNGLSYLIDRVKGHKLYAHIALEKGERSELANVANDLL
ncbi:MAG: PhoH family protein [Bacteroidetes bacterium]|nr:MAG: PhoH family protein [Bacteroidota bacterium]MBL1145589.1 PhoH family protein [Bacteroidota bacterium]MCB0803185.1 PhoH family protein [Flavobacteriales bacterium]NOG58385.1 PhoH family protein [Bacteroidota bacterium]